MDNKSLSHTKWKCQYHIIFIPKYRKKILYGRVRNDVREIISTLCKYKDVDNIVGAVPRLVAILVGDAPSVNEKYVPVYNAYNGQTETMETKWTNLKKMEEETFSKIVMGKADISEFDTFVENWKSQGGDQILKEINEELSK